MSIPLGDYEPFRRWTGKPRAWGPEDAGWPTWFGGKVIDGLCGVLDEHLGARSAADRMDAAVREGWRADGRELPAAQRWSDGRECREPVDGGWLGMP
jgi:hypothetical protein